jgi:hypothetical protein
MRFLAWAFKGFQVYAIEGMKTMCNAKKILLLLIIGLVAATEPVLAGSLSDSDTVLFQRSDFTPYLDALGAKVEPIFLEDSQELAVGERQISLLNAQVNLNVTGIAYLDEQHGPTKISDIITIKFTIDPNATERILATIQIRSDLNSGLALPAGTSVGAIFVENGDYIDITSALFDIVAAGETKTVYNTPGPPYPFLVRVLSDLDVPGVPEAPEPTALTLCGLGALGLLSYAWWRRKQVVCIAST